MNKLSWLSAKIEISYSFLFMLWFGMSWMNESTATKLDYISLALRHPKQPSLSADPYWQSAPNVRAISTDSSNTGRSWFEHSVHAGNVLMFIVSIGWYHIEHLLFSKEKPESRAETGLKLGPILPSAHSWSAGAWSCRGAPGRDNTPPDTSGAAVTGV